MYQFLFWSPGRHPRQRPLPRPHPPGVSPLPHHVARCPAAIGRPVRGGALSTGKGLAPLALPLGHLVAEPSRLLLPGLLLGEGERSQGGPEGGAGAGGGAPQRLSGHAGSVSNRAGDGGVAVGERQPAGRRRWGDGSCHGFWWMENEPPRIQWSDRSSSWNAKLYLATASLIQVFAAYLSFCIAENVIFEVCLWDKLQNMKTSSRALGTCDCIFNNTKWR